MHQYQCYRFDNNIKHFSHSVDKSIRECPLIYRDYLYTCNTVYNYIENLCSFSNGLINMSIVHCWQKSGPPRQNIFVSCCISDTVCCRRRTSQSLVKNVMFIDFYRISGTTGHVNLAVILFPTHLQYGSLGDCPWSIQWRHNQRDGVANHRRLECLLKRLFKHTVKSPHKGPATRKMLPFYDVIM